MSYLAAQIATLEALSRAYSQHADRLGNKPEGHRLHREASVHQHAAEMLKQRQSELERGPLETIPKRVTCPTCATEFDSHPQNPQVCPHCVGVFNAKELRP